MRRLNPTLKRWLLWIGIFTLSTCICFGAPELFKNIDPENEHRLIREELKNILTPIGGLSLWAIMGPVFYGLAWMADSVKRKGLSATFFFDPLLGERSKKKAQGRPLWRFFFLRAASFVALSIVFAQLASRPYTHDPVSQYKFLEHVGSILMVFVLIFLMGSAFRYYVRRDGNAKIVSLEIPDLYPYLNDPALLLSLTPPKICLDRERRTEAWWNLMVLAQSGLEAEGKLDNGTVFSIKLEHRMPWFRPARLAAVIRVYATKSRATATISAKAATIFPAEAAVNLEPVLSEAQAFLLPRDSSFLFVTTQYVQASLPRVSSVIEAFEAVWIALRIQANLQASRDGGYRGDSSLSATPAEIARIEAIAEKAWASFPSKPRGSQS